LESQDAPANNQKAGGEKDDHPQKHDALDNREKAGNQKDRDPQDHNAPGNREKAGNQKDRCPQDHNAPGNNQKAGGQKDDHPQKHNALDNREKAGNQKDRDPQDHNAPGNNQKTGRMAGFSTQGYPTQNCPSHAALLNAGAGGLGRGCTKDKIRCCRVSPTQNVPALAIGMAFFSFLFPSAGGEGGTSLSPVGTGVFLNSTTARLLC